MKKKFKNFFSYPPGPTFLKAWCHGLRSFGSKKKPKNGGGGVLSELISTFIQFFCVITSAVQRGTVSGGRHINEADDDMGRGILDNHEKYVKIAGLAAR